MSELLPPTSASQGISSITMCRDVVPSELDVTPIRRKALNECDWLTKHRSRQQITTFKTKLASQLLGINTRAIRKMKGFDLLPTVWESSVKVVWKKTLVINSSQSLTANHIVEWRGWRHSHMSEWFSLNQIRGSLFYSVDEVVLR